jgi:hypothetical protein
LTNNTQALPASISGLFLALKKKSTLTRTAAFFLFISLLSFALVTRTGISVGKSDIPKFQLAQPFLKRIQKRKLTIKESLLVTANKRKLAYQLRLLPFMARCRIM